jgi:group I intron endonuclease
VDLAQRFCYYYSLIRINKTLERSSSRILHSLKKYGYSNSKLEVLEYCDREGAITREQYYLNLLKPEYNILKIAGSLLGYKHSEKTIAKLSEIRKGKPHSEETRIKISEGNKGKICS